MQRDDFLKMFNSFARRPPLRDDGNFKAFGNIAGIVTRSNHGFDGLLQIAHMRHPAYYRHPPEQPDSLAEKKKKKTESLPHTAPLLA